MLFGAPEYFYIRYVLEHQPREGGVLRPDLSKGVRDAMRACARLLDKARKAIDDALSKKIA